MRSLEHKRVAKMLKAHYDGDLRLSDFELGFLESIESYDDDRMLSKKQELVFENIWNRYGDSV